MIGPASNTVSHEPLARRPVLALVPARGGSKGIVRKNLALLRGKPLIEFTVRAALDAVGVTQAWVSSDDEEVLVLATALGAQALRRPAALATDEASAVGVVEHFLSSLPGHVLAADPQVLYLQPTSPLRTAHHIDDALAGMAQAGATSVMSVVEMAQSPFKAFRLDEQGRLLSLFDERKSNMRRQDLPTCYLPNGAIYAFPASAFHARGGFPSNGAWPYVMSEDDSLDIDAPSDLLRAAQLLGDHDG